MNRPTYSSASAAVCATDAVGPSHRVEREQRAGRPREPAQRLVESGLGEHEARVRERGLREDQRDVAGRKGALERRPTAHAHEDV